MDTSLLYYIAVKASLHASDTQVFGLQQQEVTALTNRLQVQGEVLNGVLVKGPALGVINRLNEIGYRVICCSGENEITWTLAREL